MTVKVIVDLGFGDSGKGVVTEYLCSKNPKDTLVVRFSGGHQCGHKVIKDGIEHVFSNFGAGTLNGCPTYWSELCTVEPVGLWNEYTILREKGIGPKLYVHPSCPVTTLYDVVMNRKSVELEHGTTGIGFYRTKKRCEDGVGLEVQDIVFGSIEEIAAHMERVRKYYKLGEELDLSVFNNACNNLSRIVSSGDVVVSSRMPEAKHLVFEGSQGLMLDEKIGHMPHCTPSDLTPRNVLKMGYSIDEVVLVSRVYQTRHGNGPMTNEDRPVGLKNTEKETNVSHRYQGEFRTSMLDLDQLKYAKVRGIDSVVPKETKVSLVMTCADQMSLYPITVGKEVKVFEHAEALLGFVGEKLGVTGRLYLSRGPSAGSIQCVGKG